MKIRKNQNRLNQVYYLVWAPSWGVIMISAIRITRVSTRLFPNVSVASVWALFYYLHIRDTRHSETLVQVHLAELCTARANSLPPQGQQADFDWIYFKSWQQHVDEIFYSLCAEQDLRINWRFYEVAPGASCMSVGARLGARGRKGAPAL